MFFPRVSDEKILQKWVKKRLKIVLKIKKSVVNNISVKNYPYIYYLYILFYSIYGNWCVVPLGLQVKDTIAKNSLY